MSDELENVKRILEKERNAWAEERGQYQRQITELRTNTLPAVNHNTEHKKMLRKRVAELREQLAKSPSQDERNALAIELSALEPQIA